MNSPYEASTDLLSDLHQRYLNLSGRFKSAWTFHQFLKGVNKVFAEQSLELGTVSFQSIYSELKIASKNLNVASAEVANNHLDRAESELGRRLEALLEVDARLTPTLLRRFFKRVRNYDARILGQLLKFYLFAGADAWTDDRLDKADFLLTRLGELLLELDVEPLDRQPHALRDSLRGIWQVVEVEQPGEETVGRVVEDLHALRAAMEEIESLEDFHEKGAIQSYRSFKKNLGDIFFHPQVALPIVETNLFLAERVEMLYQREERRVALEYNKVFDLERDVPELEDTLDSELRTFRTQVEDLERSVRGQNVKIDQIVSVSESARGLIPRLEDLGRLDSHKRSDSAWNIDSAGNSDSAGNRDPDGQDGPNGRDQGASRQEIANQVPFEKSAATTQDSGEAANADGDQALDEEGLEHAPLREDDGPEAESLQAGSEASSMRSPQVPTIGPLPDFFDAPLMPRTSLDSPTDPGAFLSGAEQPDSGTADNGTDSEGGGLRLNGDDDLPAEDLGEVDNWQAGLSPTRPEETLRIRTAYADQLGEVLRQVLQVLEETDWLQPPKLVVQIPEVRGLRLEPREVLAYRRLFSPEKFERGLEQFLIEGASLRVMMGYQAEELADYTGQSGEQATADLRREALSIVGLASEFEKRCQHFVQEAVYARRTADAAALQVVWMRMLREYSGLWLLLHRQ